MTSRPEERLFEQLRRMVPYLEERLRLFRGPAARRRPSSGAFAFVENLWHLADLEREGYGERILRLAVELRPDLPDFEGDRVARERNYIALDPARGFAAFRAAREENLHRLASVAPADWSREGVQAGAGRITLGDVPRMMADHDASHRREIEALFLEILSAGDER
jgi:hypothetical protein